MFPKLIDTHTHMHFNAFTQDMDLAIGRALEHGTWMITIGTQSTTSKNAVEIANQYTEGLYATVGLHPNHLFPVYIDENELPESPSVPTFTSRSENFDYEYFKALAQDKKVVGIGECGLDYFHLPATVDLETVRKKQEEVFRKHCDLATELHLPLVVHCRDAQDDTLPILEEYVAAGKLPARGVSHCFAGTRMHAQRYLELDFYISFTGVITFPPKKSTPEVQEELWHISRTVPEDRMLIETDAPYLTPIPHRGERNESLYVEFVAQKLAELRGISFETIAEQTMKNARRLFKI